MPRVLQCLTCSRGMLCFNQDVVRVKGRNRKNGHTVLSQGIDKGRQNSGLREGEWAFELEASPQTFTFRVARSLVGATNNRQLVTGSSDRGERFSCRQLRGRSIRRETKDRKASGELAGSQAR